MREILFRGKRIDNGEWVYGNLIGNSAIVGEIVEFNDEYFNTECWYSVDPETVGQYTGLKDKNGQKIYEGDIIEQPDYSGGARLYGNQPTKKITVKFEVDKTDIGKKAGFNLRLGFIEGLYKGKLIGNIHE